MTNPKTLKKIPVAPHVREGHPVKGYEATREVNIEQFSEKSKAFLDKASKLREHLFDDAGNLKISQGEAELDVYDLYKTEGNGVESEVTKYDSALAKLHNGLKTTFINYEDPRFTSPLIKEEKTIGEKILNILTNPDFIKETINKTNEVRAFIENDMGIKTEEIDPFSFKFRSETEHVPDAEDVYRSLNNKDIFNEINSTLSKKHGDLFGEDPAVDVHLISRQLESANRHGLLNNRKAGSTIIPSIIIESLASSNFMNAKSDNAFDFIPKTHLVRHGLKEFNQPNMLIFGEPNKIRQSATDSIKGLNLENKDVLLKYLKKVEDKAIIPFVNSLAHQESMPKFLVDNPNVLTNIQKISEKIRGVMEGLKPVTESNTLAMSRNPLAILTMSPYQTAPSCQSILDKRGDLKIGDEYNINIPGSINTHRTYDTILYSTNKDDEKVARVSLTFNKDKNMLINFENKKVFGEGKKERGVVNNFMMSQEEKIQVASKQDRNISYRPTSISDSLANEYTIQAQKIAGELHTAKKENDYNKINQLKGDIHNGNTKLRNALDSVNKTIYTAISRQLDICPTFLYDSGTPALFDDVAVTLETSVTKLQNTKKSYEYLNKISEKI